MKIIRTRNKKPCLRCILKKQNPLFANRTNWLIKISEFTSIRICKPCMTKEEKEILKHGSTEITMLENPNKDSMRKSK